MYKLARFVTDWYFSLFTTQDISAKEKAGREGLHPIIKYLHPSFLAAILSSGPALAPVEETRKKRWEDGGIKDRLGQTDMRHEIIFHY